METLVQDSLDFLYRSVKSLTSPDLRFCCNLVLNDPAFRRSPAAAKKHQAYIGGLVVHTAEVLTTALLMAQSVHLKADKDVLITAAIYHDYGKIYDYTDNPKWNDYSEDKSEDNPQFIYTEHRKLIRHLSRSYAMFMKNVKTSVPEHIIDSIGHCILAHHGRQEWGSPVEPSTAEAFILHYADNLSARCGLPNYERNND